MNGGTPGTSLGSDGFARLITPDDIAHGRWVSNLVNLEIFDAANWKILAGETMDIGGFGFQTLCLIMQGGTLTSSRGAATFTSPSYACNGGLTAPTVALGGSGSATQVSGTTVLGGKNTYTGGTTVNGGTLLVANLMQGITATIPGPITVNAGATFGGIGVVGS